MPNHSLRLIGAALLLAGAASYVLAQRGLATLPASPVQPAPVQPDPVQPSPIKAGVHSIRLPDIPAPQFPPGPGQLQFEVACSTCHSLRYVTMQPPFSRTVWDSEVHKMINNYKAQISPEQISDIVNYLAKVHGTADPAAK